MSFSRVIFKKEIQDSFHSLMKILQKKDSKLVTLRAADGEVYTTNKIYSFLKELYSSSLGIDAMISGMLLEHVHESEKIVPGSGKVFIKFLLGMIENKNIHELMHTNENVRDLRKSDIDSILEFTGISTEAFAIVKESIMMAGLTGKIFIDQSNKAESIIELKSGYNFSFLLPIGPFRGQKKWNKSWCKCLIIDGVIETLGEIDGILCDATKENVPLAIFARGFSSDVINTLKVNADRGTLDICPISFGTDNIETVNSIADIARVVGSDVITPLKGDLISACRLDSLKSVQKIICYNGNVTLINSVTEADVKFHINDLMSRADNSHFDVSKLLNDRIKSLSGTCVLILLGSNLLIQKNILIEEIDAGLNIIKSAVKWGVIESDDADLDMLDGLGINGKNIIPASLVPTAQVFSKKFMNNINLIDVGIVCDSGKSKNA